MNGQQLFFMFFCFLWIWIVITTATGLISISNCSRGAYVIFAKMNGCRMIDSWKLLDNPARRASPDYALCLFVPNLIIKVILHICISTVSNIASNQDLYNSALLECYEITSHVLQNALRVNITPPRGYIFRRWSYRKFVSFWKDKSDRFLLYDCVWNFRFYWPISTDLPYPVSTPL